MNFAHLPKLSAVARPSFRYYMYLFMSDVMAHPEFCQNTIPSGVSAFSVHAFLAALRSSDGIPLFSRDAVRQAPSAVNTPARQ
eukprot:SAG11_NODE_1416_length_4973_cov_2.727329_3_plen_83_part_00